MKPTRTRVLLAALFALVHAPRAYSAPLWISEVLYDAAASDDGLVFVELWGTPGLPLDGWLIEGVNGTDGALGPILALAGSVPADGFFVLADTLAGTTSVPEADQLANFDFQNADQERASARKIDRSWSRHPTTPASVGQVQGCCCVASVSPLGRCLMDPT